MLGFHAVLADHQALGDVPFRLFKRRRLGVWSRWDTFRAQPSTNVSGGLRHTQVFLTKPCSKRVANSGEDYPFHSLKDPIMVGRRQKQNNSISTRGLVRSCSCYGRSNQKFSRSNGCVAPQRLRRADHVVAFSSKDQRTAGPAGRV